VDPHIGSLGEPTLRHFVQMLQRRECPAVQQVGFQILKWPFDLAFSLRTVRPAGPGLETIMRRECQEAGVIDGLIAVVTGYHHFHVVVQTGGGQSLKVFESADMFPDRGRKILRLHKAQILATRITQHIAEGIHSPAAFGRKRDIVRRIVHLGLNPWTCLEPLYRRLGGVRPHGAQMFFHDAVAALEAQSAEFFMQADGGQIRVTFQELSNLIHVRVQQTRTARLYAFCFPGPMALVLLQHPIHALAVDSQLARDGSLRSAGVA
jgi:hypothetical protein